MEKFYVTGYAPKYIPQQQLPGQISMEECYAAYFGGGVPEEPAIINYPSRFFQTRTKCVEVLTPPSGATLRRIDTMQDALMHILSEHTELLADTAQAYETFYVPKRSGGMREINAPKEELKYIQRDVLRFFTHGIGMLPHNAAYAYIAGRSTRECMMVHQQNQSQWFLKLDIKDFFPSCSVEFVEKALLQVYPVPFLNADYLKQIIAACALKGSLPQGAPSSPYLTNLIMVPYDYKIQNRLWDYDRTHYVYTRYADDIIISSQYEFDSNQVAAVVVDILGDTPFRIKAEKTRYGSRAGRNWNLGLMLNKDNNLSLGHKFKQRFRAAIFSFLSDYKNNVAWEAEDVHQLSGWYSYFKSIEPEYAAAVMRRYETKLQVQWRDALRWMLQ